MRNSPRICAVIPAQNVAGSVANVLWQLHRAKVTHAILVINGSQDGTYQVAQNTLKRVPVHSKIIHIAVPLGPDVPRAIGLYQALRSFSDVDWFLILDGDWAGGFGPMLEESISLAVSEQFDVQFTPRQPNTGVSQGFTRRMRTDYTVWDAGLRDWDKGLQDIAPSEAPVLIHRRTLDRVSPVYLYHPGLWFAIIIAQTQRGLRIGISNNWINKLVGNPSPSIAHATRMQETLIGDALEGARLLHKQKPHRYWHGVLYDGYNSSRRVDLLEKWQSYSSLRQNLSVL